MSNLSHLDMNGRTRPALFLIIDDDSDDREIFMSAIRDVAPDTVCNQCADPEQFLRASSAEPAPDVIFVDINMPRMDGFQFIAEANKTGILNHSKVVMYSTSRSSADLNKAKALGAHSFITKTNTYPELCEQLKKCLSSITVGGEHKVQRISDAIAQVLVARGEYKTVNEAKSALYDTFCKSFPKWSYDEWDEGLSDQAFAILTRTLSKIPLTELKILILDLIPVVRKLRSWR